MLGKKLDLYLVILIYPRTLIFYGISFQSLRVLDNYTEAGFSWSPSTDPNMSKILSQHKMDILFNELKLIRTKIENSLKRTKIIGKIYNHKTNKLEYELEDGNFIQIDGDKLIPPEIELDDTVFPDCFLYGRGRIASLRENRINDILNSDTM